MASKAGPARRPRGNIDFLPSGSARVAVYGGTDQLTGKRLQLRETVPARATRRETEREAEKVRTRLLNQVDERRSPRTGATANELLDRWLEVADIDRKTRTGAIRGRPSSRSRSPPSRSTACSQTKEASSCRDGR